MNKKDQERFDKLMQDARDITFEAAEAMDRRDLAEWTRLQNRAEGLRKKANEIKSPRQKPAAKRKVK